MKPIVTLILALLFFLGCSDNRYYHEFELDELSFDADAMHKIQKMSGFHIPENSIGLNFAYKPPMDPGFAAKIEIPPTGKEAVLKQIELIAGQVITSSGGLPERVTWWPTSPENVLATKQVFNGDPQAGTIGYFHAIFAREKEKYILYLNYHTP
jgi:hypothetical protein